MGDERKLCVKLNNIKTYQICTNIKNVLLNLFSSDYDIRTTGI